jgi:hypothetical protein
MSNNNSATVAMPAAETLLADALRMEGTQDTGTPAGSADAGAIETPAAASLVSSPRNRRSAGDDKSAAVLIKAGDVSVSLPELQKALNDAKAAAGRVNATAQASHGITWETSTGKVRKVIATSSARGNGASRAALVPESVCSQLKAAKLHKAEDCDRAAALNRFAKAVEDLMKFA